MLNDQLDHPAAGHAVHPDALRVVQRQVHVLVGAHGGRPAHLRQQEQRNFSQPTGRLKLVARHSNAACHFSVDTDAAGNGPKGQVLDSASSLQ